MQELLIDILKDTAIDSIKILPFLFLAYLFMEYLEHKALGKSDAIIQKSGQMGPLIGSILGVFPQCGFSAAASNLYAGRLITTGTLLAVFLSTSDEMLPIFLSENVPVIVILKILGMKVIIGIIAGFAIDLILRFLCHQDEVHDHHDGIHEICEHEHCNCEKNFVASAFKHTIQILFYIFIISLILNLIIGFTGEDKLAAFIVNRPIIGELLASIIGLIPNCAASVVITELYLENILSLGAMMSGLLVSAGVGLLVLFRINHPMKDNFKILGLLYIVGLIAGIVIELSGLHI